MSILVKNNQGSDLVTSPVKRDIPVALQLIPSHLNFEDVPEYVRNSKIEILNAYF